MANTTRCSNAGPRKANCSAVVGLQWGDEGKGKAVDLLAAQHDAVVRYNGGANAGHSVVVGGTRYALHLIPSGILYPGKHAVIANGVVVDPWKLIEELDALATRGVDTRGLVISSRAHVVLPYHKLEDGLREDLLKGGGGERAQGVVGISEIGTTRRGIGPAYADKVQRASGVRMGDLLRPGVLGEKLDLAVTIKRPLLRELAGKQPDIDLPRLREACEAVGARLGPMITDTTYLLHSIIDQGRPILFEGANGTLLDVDHGTYPFVTASNCGSAGIPAGTGVPMANVSRVLGVMKAYSTRVGSGPLPTELKDATGDRIRERGREFGTTTGRPRRVGWLDLVAVRYSAMINGVTGLAITLLDVLAGFDELRVCTAYSINGEKTERFLPDAIDLAQVQPVWTSLPGFGEDIGACKRREDLPAGARRYVEFVEESVGVPADIISVGPDREQTMVRAGVA